MFKFLKNTLFFLMFITSYINYSAKLEDVSYKNGEIILTFDSKVSNPSFNNTKISSNGIDYTVLELSEKNASINNEIIKNLSINDKYFKNIIIDTIDKNTIALYAYMQYGYSSKVTYNDNIIKINKSEINIPKKISPTTNKPLTIVLDAGHGGHDSGAKGFGKLEKDIALEVVLKLAENLKRDYKVILTRSDDTFISLSERPKIGNRNSADLFVSIHLNASSSSSANGAEIFYFSKETNPYTEKLIEYEEKLDSIQAQKVSLVNQILGDFFISKTKEKSANLANFILNKYVNNLGFRKRGVFGANFAVLRGSESPSILIELGFITNNSDLSILSSQSGQDNVVISIADSIRENFEE